MTRTLVRILTAAVVFTLCGCARNVRGDFEQLLIQSTPPGASVLILPYRERVETPASIKLRRDTSLTLFVKKTGYESTRVYIDREADPWAMLPYAGNLLFGGIIGLAIDMGSGTLFHLVPNPVEIVLEREPEPETPTLSGPASNTDHGLNESDIEKTHPTADSATKGAID